MSPLNWRPTASLDNQRLRAKLLQLIRQFFSDRGVLEVETPLLSKHTVTDIHLNSFRTVYQNEKIKQNYYLQTSPEYAMKRLLAAGSGPIYQICKAFRNGEQGAQHNPEFTLLEWYRPGFTYSDLMDEMDDFLQLTIHSKKAIRRTYKDLFLERFLINPFEVSLSELQGLASESALNHAHEYMDRDILLQWLFSDGIEPGIGFDAPVFVTHFPASQAALARIDPENSDQALRFEVYIQGMECANGFEELTDVHEQRQRFEQDNVKRKERTLPEVAIDGCFLAALEFGLPPCSGVALGLDRLLMIKAKVKNISDVIAFTAEIA